MSAHEVSTKGMLDLRPDGLRRLAAAHCALVAKAVKAALDRATDQCKERVDVAALAGRVVAEALSIYPIDRSCATCDWSRDDPALPSGLYCTKWDDSIPTAAVEAGCDEHKTDALPF